MALMRQYPRESAKMTKMTGKSQNGEKIIPLIKRFSCMTLGKLKIKHVKNYLSAIRGEFLNI